MGDECDCAMAAKNEAVGEVEKKRKDKKDTAGAERKKKKKKELKNATEGKGEK